MRISRRMSLFLGLGLLVVTLGVTVWLTWGDNTLFKSKADLNMAKDISDLSGLSKEMVLDLYDEIGNWDQLKENIFVYKRALNLAKGDSQAHQEVFDLAGAYQAKDILTVYEFLAGNKYDLAQAEQLLKQQAQGASMEAVLGEVADSKAYKVYKPAGEQQVRQWLAKGYTPEDILNADNIARSKDMDIAEVLSEKGQNLTWQQVSINLGFDSVALQNSTASIKVQDHKGEKTLTAKDYETLAREANLKAEQAGQTLEQQICQRYGLTPAQMSAYKEQGFSVRDVDNAARLAQKSGKSMEKILADRKAGQQWADIINQYLG